MSYASQPAFLTQAAFTPISLDSLNAKAAMLERLDNKYVVDASVLELASDGFARHFDILEIDGVRSFNYETWYFDDARRQSYCDHHQGRRRRVKVRVRRYVEADLCFVEVKLKDKRGLTVKKRMPYEMEKYGTLDARALNHVETCYRDLYGEAFGRELEAALEVCYARTTLVAKTGGERLTIDNGLRFRTLEDAYAVSNRFFIIETKSANGNGIADKVLRELNQHPTKHCSKYCVGTAATGGAPKFNKFRPALKRMGALTSPRMSGAEHALAV